MDSSEKEPKVSPSNVLVVYSRYSEGETLLFGIEDASEELIKLLSRCQGQYLGFGDDCLAVQELKERLDTLLYYGIAVLLKTPLVPLALTDVSIVFCGEK